MEHSCVFIYEGDVERTGTILIPKNTTFMYSDVIIQCLESIGKDINTVNAFLLMRTDQEVLKPITDLNAYADVTDLEGYDLLFCDKGLQKSNKRSNTHFGGDVELHLIGKQFLEDQKFMTADLFFQYTGMVDHLETTRMFYRLKNWTQVQSLSMALTKLMPNSVEASLIMGDVFEHFGLYSVAMSLYKQLSMFFPDEIAVKIAPARVLSNFGDVKKALETIQKFYNQYKSNPTILKLYAKILIMSDQIEAAIHIILRNAACYGLLAYILRSESGRAIFDNLMPLYDFSADSIIEIAKKLYYKGYINEAESLMRKNYEKHSNNMRYVFCLSYLSVIVGHYKESELYLIENLLKVFAPNKVADNLHESKAMELEIPLSKESYVNQLYIDDSYVSAMLSLSMLIYKIQKSNESIVEVYLLSDIFPKHAYPAQDFPEIQKFFSDTPAIAGESKRDFIGSIAIVEDGTCSYLLQKYVCIGQSCYRFISSMVPKFSLLGYPKGNFNFNRSLIEIAAAKSANAPFILLNLGQYDCEYAIPRAINEMKYSNVTECITAAIESYSSVIEIFISTNPEAKLIILPPIATKYEMIGIVHLFNTQLVKTFGESQIIMKPAFKSTSPIESVPLITQSNREDYFNASVLPSLTLVLSSIDR